MARRGQGGDYFLLLEQGRLRRFPAKLKFLVCWGKEAAELLREDSHGHNPQARMPLKWWNKHCSDQALQNQASEACRKGLECLRQKLYKHDSRNSTPELQPVPAGWWQPESLGQCPSDPSDPSDMRLHVSFGDLVKHSVMSRREGEKHNPTGLWRPRILLTELNRRVLQLSWVRANKRLGP